MDENTALNEATTTTPTTTIEKKGYTLLVVSLALLLGVTFYAGQMHGARTSRAVDGGTTRGATMVASLTMMSNDADYMRHYCSVHTDRASCVAATGFYDDPCIWARARGVCLPDVDW